MRIAAVRSSVFTVADVGHAASGVDAVRSRTEGSGQVQPGGAPIHLAASLLVTVTATADLTGAATGLAVSRTVTAAVSASLTTAIRLAASRSVSATISRAVLSVGDEERVPLTSADLTYLGGFKLPPRDSVYIGINFAFTDMPMTGYRNGDDIHLLAVGARTYGQPITEVVFPGIPALSTSLASMTRVGTYQGWNTWWEGENHALEQSIVHGVHLHEGVLYWGYGAIYSGSYHDPSIGATVLNYNGNGTTVAATAASINGPWRTDLHRGYTCGWMQTIPAWFRDAYLPGGPTLVIGNPTRANNATSPFGAEMIAFTPPALSTPADSDDPGDVTITTEKLLFHDINHPQARNTNAIVDQTNTQFEPVFAGGFTGNLLDWMDSCCWIDNGTKHGILYAGQLVDIVEGFTYTTGTLPHNWYGSDTCAHGHDAPASEGQGPGASTLVNYFWFYDPLDLVPVINGDIDPWEVAPTEVIKAHTIGGFCQEHRQKLYKFGGMHFDPTDSLLFLAEKDVYNDESGEPQAVIHVFQVAR